MSVVYRTLYFSSRDHEKVSNQWFILLWDIRHHDHVAFNVNEGHRTMKRQQELYDELGEWSPSNPHGAAKPSPNAPHIRSGRPYHAIDFDNAEGVRQAAHKRGVALNRPISQEPWHMDPDPEDLARYAKRNSRRVARELAAARAKKAIFKATPGMPSAPSNKLVDFLASWEGMRLKAYQVEGEKFWTIGVGHTGEVNGVPVHEGMTITADMALKLLRGDLKDAEIAVERLVPARWRRRQRRYDTCVSMAFNMGAQILTPQPPLTSFGLALQKPVTAQTIREAARTINLYNKGGSPLRVMQGLVKRRAAEATLFETGKYIHNR